MGLLERLRATPAHIVGHSYGGFISLYVAAHHPEMVRSFVLVEPAVSTLLISGESSALVLRGIGQILAESIPDCERARISGAGHFPHLDKAEEFNARVLGFLQLQS